MCSSDLQLDLVEALLDGTEVWPGLAVDADLRWFLLQRLVTAGRRDLDAIEHEVDGDNTATGHRQAAVARASRPTAEAKEEAWVDIVDRPDLPNAIIDATIGGFAQRDQLELLAPYRDRYFEVLPRVWADRTMEIASSITMGLYPVYLVDDDTLAATDRFLSGEVPSACRRLVSEARDGVLRCARARARDAQD